MACSFDAKSVGFIVGTCKETIGLDGNKKYFSTLTSQNPPSHNLIGRPGLDVLKLLLRGCVRWDVAER